MSLSYRKKILFSGILICFVWIIIEIISYGAYRWRYGKLTLSKAERNHLISELNQQQDLKSPQAKKNKKNWNVIHPYLGFVTEGFDPNRKCPEHGLCDQRLRTYDDKPFVKSTEENLIVAVIGGSFAGGVSYGSGRGYLEKQLKKIPRFSNKEIILYHLAPGGYKQPQQLIKINYFLTLGAEFDLIINVDGFNEIALPRVENLSKGVHPVFPRSWYYYVDTSLNQKLLALYGKRENYKLAQFHWASFFSKPVLDFLPSMNLLWKFGNQKLQYMINMADVALVEYRENGERKLRYATTGPDYNFISWNEFYQDMAEVWARSSLQLYNICRGQGIEYFHFLQPNQYVEGSKPMSEKEERIAISSKSKYGMAAAEGYPFLIRQGKWLEDHDVQFYDLTRIFSDNPKQFYIDNCCHLNREGYQLVVNEIVRLIREDHNKVR